MVLLPSSMIPTIPLSECSAFKFPSSLQLWIISATTLPPHTKPTDWKLGPQVTVPLLASAWRKQTMQGIHLKCMFCCQPQFIHIHSLSLFSPFPPTSSFFPPLSPLFFLCLSWLTWATSLLHNMLPNAYLLPHISPKTMEPAGPRLKPLSPCTEISETVNQNKPFLFKG